MHSSAQPFAARTICSASTSAPRPACSCGTSTTTWCTAASTASSNSCRSSDTIAKDGARSLSASASSSISAGVACLPAKTPKLTRISMPGSSWSRTRSEIAGSSKIGLMPDSYPAGGTQTLLTLSRLPAELEDREDQARDSPGGEDCQRLRLRPDAVAVQVYGIDELDEVRERQHVTDRAENSRVAPRRSERATQERHRQKDEVDHRGGALGRADHRGGRGAERREHGSADDDGCDERADVGGKRRPVERASEQEERQRLEREHDQRRGEDRGDVRRGRQR